MGQGAQAAVCLCLIQLAACNPAIRRAESKPYIASMGIYVMQAKALRQLLMDSLPNANDFGNEIIPGAREAGMKVQAYAFQV